MTHLIVCREYPPAPHPPGGIGTYTTHIARLLAEAGETVHIIAQGWRGAPAGVSELCGGRLIVHRVTPEEPATVADQSREARVLTGMLQSDCPSQVFAWQTARIAEKLVEQEEIDLIEAPEWEASLYYFQLRRALGLGPSRQPPCVVHLHGPADFIIRANEWDESLADLLPLRRFEEYTIRAADAILCPSRYLAQGAAERFGLVREDIAVIPYPLDEAPRIERADAVWGRNRICYVGRLELRKGILEWIDAAVETARSDSRVEFDFVGSDTSLDGSPDTSVRAVVDARIPAALRHRFHFQPSRPREELRRLLAEVPVAVVPSRWDNLPYTCIEAMCSGLPVLVSPNGGMAELVRDGESGWVSADGSPAALAAALRLVLETPAERRKAMGRNAEAAARRACANDTVLEQQMEFRSRVARAGTTRSHRVPGVPSGSVDTTGRRGSGIVVTCLEHPELLDGCIGAIRKQSVAAAVIVVAIREGVDAAIPSDCKTVKTAANSIEELRAAGVKKLLAEAPDLRAVAFVTESVRLEAGYLSKMEAVLQSQAQVGIVSSLVVYGAPWNELDTTPLPVSYAGSPLADAAACLTVRTEAIASAGWAAFTYPEVLASCVSGATAEPKRYSAMALSQGGSPKMALQWFQEASFGQKVRSMVRVFKQPRRMAQWAGWLLRAAVSKAR